MNMIVEERSWLVWLVKVRIIVLTFLLGIQLAIVRLTPTTLPVKPFISVMLLWYTLSVFSLVLLSMWREGRLQSVLQVVSDLFMATLVVYVTGGIDSSYNFLYPLILIVACILLPKVWAYLSAALAFVLYGAVIEMCYFDVIPSYSSTNPSWRTLQAIILINLFAYLTIAYLAGHLADRLRQADVQLRNASGALEDLQAMHQHVVQSISSGLITTGLDGHITLANPAAQKLLSQTEQKLRGKLISELFLDPLPHVGAAGAHAEVRCTGARGEPKTLALRATTLTVPGRGVQGCIYTLEDMSEIRRLEHEVRMREQLAAVGRLGAAIAHEIRNPLSSIAGSVKVLSGIATLADEQRLLIEIAMRESERLNTVISEFVEYSRGRQLDFAVTDIVPLLENTVDRWRDRLRKEFPALSFDLHLGAPQAIVLGDAERLRQVFSHLCRNAVRSMRGQGKIVIRLQKSSETWQVSFADSGDGLSPQDAARIFEPFAGTDGGAGLDLAIAYQIAQAHQGSVRVKSLPGQGAVFTVELPEHAAAVPEPSPVTGVVSPGQAAAAAGGGARG